MIRILFRILLAIVIAYVGYIYFSSILPPGGAMVASIVLALAELVGPMLGRGGGSNAGAGMRLMLRSGLPFLTWPGFAWLLYFAGIAERDVRIALAAGAASFLGVFLTHHGQGRDQYHLVSVLVTVTIPVIALVVALTSGSHYAVAAGCAAVGVGLWAARTAHVWADEQTRAFQYGAFAAVVAGAAVFARALM